MNAIKQTTIKITAIRTHKVLVLGGKRVLSYKRYRSGKYTEEKSQQIQKQCMVSENAGICVKYGGNRKSPGKSAGKHGEKHTVFCIMEFKIQIKRIAQHGKKNRVSCVPRWIRLPGRKVRLPCCIRTTHR